MEEPSLPGTAMYIIRVDRLWDFTGWGNAQHSAVRLEILIGIFQQLGLTGRQERTGPSKDSRSELGVHGVNGVAKAVSDAVLLFFLLRFAAFAYVVRTILKSIHTPCVTGEDDR